MGCFNVSGTMSNLTIGSGDKIAFFLLSPTNSHYKVQIGEPTSTFSSNDGACVFMQPFCPPIYGEYDDYGGVENIVKTQTTKDLEEYFGNTIESIISIITGYDREFDCKLDDEEVAETRVQELLSLSGMFEHADIVKVMAHKLEHKDNLADYGYFNDSVMKLMGFKYDGNETLPTATYSPDRYSRKWSKGDVTVYTDGTYFSNSFTVQGIQFDKSIYHPAGLNPYTDIPYELYRISTKEQAFLDYQKKCDDIGKMKRSKQRLARAFLDRRDYPDQVKNRDIGSLEERVQLAYFTSAMFSSNNYYSPAMNGEQHGNLEVDQLLHKLRGKILIEQEGLNEED